MSENFVTKKITYDFVCLFNEVCNVSLYFDCQGFFMRSLYLKYVDEIEVVLLLI